MKGSKKFLSLLLVVMMIISVCPIAAFAEDAEPVAEWFSSFGIKQGEGTVNDAFAGVASGGRISILADAEITEAATVTKNVTVVGNGHTITRNDAFAGIMITVTNGAKATFEDVTISGNKANIAADGSIIAVTSGSVVLNTGVTLKDNDTSDNGGAVLLGTDGGTAPCFLTMNDGATISGCEACYGGAVLILHSATFNMVGGTITKCLGDRDAGAVDVSRNTSAFNMTGGTITDCECSLSITEGWGSAISAEAGKVAISGGTIKNNTNVSNLGSIYVYPDCDFSIGGNVYVYDNDGGMGASNIFVANNAVIKISPEFTSGAKIGVTPETPIGADNVLRYIEYTTPITGFIYDDANSDTYYENEDGTVVVIECITVTFDPGNGTCDTASKVYPTDLSFGTLPTPDEREGFEFDGWYTANGVLITEDSAVSYRSDITLYAKWINLNELDNNIFARLGRIFSYLANLMKIAFNFLSNLFTGSGTGDLGDLK